MKIRPLELSLSMRTDA